jgi:hypothetical protein
MNPSPALVQLREQQAALSTQVEALVLQDKRSDEDNSKLDQLIAELNEVGPKLAREISIDETRRAIADTVIIRDERTVPANGQADVDPASGKPPDRRPLSDRFAASDELKEYRARPSGKSAPFTIGSFFRTRTESEQRALIHGVGGSERVDAISGGTPLMANPLRSVLNVGTTDQSAINYVREVSFTNNAAAVAEATTVSTGAKPESAKVFENVVAPVVTIAHWIPITRQSLDDNGQMRAFLEGNLLNGLVEEEIDQVVAGDGTSPNMSGILDQTGILVLDATYFTANPVPGVGTAAENFNRINAAKGAIYAASKTRATFVALNPADWVLFSGAVMDTGAFYGLGPYGAADPARLWGLTVVEANAVTAGTALVGAGSQATILDRMAGTIFVADQHSDFFIRNIFVFLAEERIALAVHKANAFANVTLA